VPTTGLDDDGGGRASPGAPRSLAEELRGLPDEHLVRLLRERPDAAVPPPPDLATLAGRLGNRASVQRAVDLLDTACLQVLEVVVALPGPVPEAEIDRRWGAPAEGPLRRLRELALVWGAPGALHPVRAARDVLGPHPAGLGPPLAEALGRRSPSRLAELVEDLGLPPTGDPEAALRSLAGHLGEPGTVDALLADAPEGARAVLERLTWGPPVGRVPDADRPVRASEASGPVEWLLARGLLAVADPGHVVLPREIGLALRGGLVHRVPDTAPPAAHAREVPAARTDAAAAGVAAETVRLVEELGATWAADPPPVLRGGGLRQRDLRRTAVALGIDEPVAALLVEVAHAAGLVADDREEEPRWLPTSRFDAWCAAGVGRQWAELAAAWRAMPRASSLVGGRDERGTVLAALDPGLVRPAARAARELVLAELVELVELAALAVAVERPLDGHRVAVDVESLLARLEWRRPRRAGPARDALMRSALREAAWLGITADDALSAQGAALLRTGDAAGLDADDAGAVVAAAAAAAALERALPPPVSHMLLQADLTAVAPGRLEPSLARELALVADVESRGAATVFRFGPASVRRALDAGRTAGDLLALLAEHSTTEVPQALRYLVEDVARRHGRVRVGVARAYLRCDDEAVLAELLADRRAAALRLRRLAPTVLAAQAPAETVLEVLRGIGLAPAGESADGDLVVARAASQRARADRPPAPGGPALPGDGALRGLVRALRATDAGAPAPGRQPVAPALAPMDPSSVLATARAAIAAHHRLWIAHVDGNGSTARLLVEPVAVEGGRISALDLASAQLRTFALHRVSSAAPQG
jgi:hypothetical protein